MRSPYKHTDTHTGYKPPYQEYVGNKNFVHRDLAARNVLISTNKQVKVCNNSVLEEARYNVVVWLSYTSYIYPYQYGNTLTFLNPHPNTPGQPL